MIKSFHVKLRRLWFTVGRQNFALVTDFIFLIYLCCSFVYRKLLTINRYRCRFVDSKETAGEDVPCCSNPRSLPFVLVNKIQRKMDKTTILLFSNFIRVFIRVFRSILLETLKTLKKPTSRLQRNRKRLPQNPLNASKPGGQIVIKESVV